MSNSLKYWIEKFKIPPTGVLHAGAHLVQERDVYRQLGLEPVLWIEAHPKIAVEAKKLLEGYPGQRLINAALWGISNHEIFLSEAGNEGSSSSLLELGLITGSHPQVVRTGKFKVKTKTLEEILEADSDFCSGIHFLCVDTQGAEAEVIKGLGEKILQFEYILAEVSIRRLYKGAVLFNDLTSQLSIKGFTLVASNINENTGWGDALYIRTQTMTTLGITQADYEHILTSEGSALATRFRYLLLRLGVPNNIVAKISRGH